MFVLFFVRVGNNVESVVKIWTSTKNRIFNFLRIFHEKNIFIPV